MTKSKKVVLKLSFEEASDVLMALIESQKGYTDGSSVPNRIVNIRSVLDLLDESMEDYISNKTGE